MAFALMMALALLTQSDSGLPMRPGTPLDWLDDLPCAGMIDRGPLGTVPLVDFTHYVSDPYSPLKDPSAPGSEPIPLAVGTTGFVRTYPTVPPLELRYFTHTLQSHMRYRSEVTTAAEGAALMIVLGTVDRAYLRNQNRQFSALFERHVRRLHDVPPPALVEADASLARLIASVTILDLSNGMAYALDPTFARHVRCLDEWAHPDLVQCARSTHPIVAHNAAALLATLPGDNLAAELRKLASESCDNVVQFRALMGLVRRLDPGALAPLRAMTSSQDPVKRTYALWLLGRLGDPKGAAIVRSQMNGLRDLDGLMTTVPALARISDRSAETLGVLRDLDMRLGPNDTVEMTTLVESAGGPPGVKVEKPGSQKKIVRQFVLIALAANGEERASRELLDRLGRKGLSSFHTAVWLLLIDGLAKIGERGVAELRKIVDARIPESLRVRALLRLCVAVKPDADWLRARAERGPRRVRIAAMRAFMDAEVCRAVVKGYAEGDGEVDGEEARLVICAVEVAAQSSIQWGSELLKAAGRALCAGNVARRETQFSEDLAQCRLLLSPPLLETFVREVGRAAPEGAEEFLLNVLHGKHARGDACLSLGRVGDKRAVEALLAALEDHDGWVRFNAYRALKVRSSLDYACDWIWGPIQECKRCAKRYREWASKAK